MATYYTNEHEWIRVDGSTGVVGITRYAADKLGDVVFVELPDVGRKVKKDGELAVVESVKAAADIFTPATGEVAEVNSGLLDEPAKVNEDPEGAGWFVKLKLADPSEVSGLMDKAAYDAFCATQG